MNGIPQRNMGVFVHSVLSLCSSSCFPLLGIDLLMLPFLFFLLNVLLYYSNVYYSSEVQSLPLNSTCIIRRTTTVDVQSPAPIQRATTVKTKSHTPKRRRTKGKVKSHSPKRRTTKEKVQRPTPSSVVLNTNTDESIARCDRLCGTVGNELYLHCSVPIPSNAATTCMFQAFRDGIVLLLTI